MRTAFRTMEKSLREESTKPRMHMQHQMEKKNFLQGEWDRINVAVENSGVRKKNRNGARKYSKKESTCVKGVKRLLSL